MIKWTPPITLWSRLPRDIHVYLIHIQKNGPLKKSKGWHGFIDWFEFLAMDSQECLDLDRTDL